MTPHTQTLIQALEGAKKFPRPWMDGGVTWPEWDAAFKAIDDALVLLATQDQPAPSPEGGWLALPPEPTEAMTNHKTYISGDWSRKNYCSIMEAARDLPLPPLNLDAVDARMTQETIWDINQQQAAPSHAEGERLAHPCTGNDTLARYTFGRLVEHFGAEPSEEDAQYAITTIQLALNEAALRATPAPAVSTLVQAAVGRWCRKNGTPFNIDELINGITDALAPNGQAATAGW